MGIKQVAYREVAEHCAAIAATKFEEQKFLAALDFSKASDKMDPAKTRNPVGEMLFEASDKSATSGLRDMSVRKCWRSPSRIRKEDRGDPQSASCG